MWFDTAPSRLYVSAEGCAVAFALRSMTDIFTFFLTPCGSGGRLETGLQRLSMSLVDTTNDGCQACTHVIA